MESSMELVVDADCAPLDIERLKPLHVKPCPSPSPSSVSYWLQPEIFDLPFEWHDEEFNPIKNADPRALRAGKVDIRAWDALVLSCMSPEHPEIALRAYLGPEAKMRKSEYHRSRGFRWGLPLIVGGMQGTKSVMACADTGSEENIISYKLAKQLHLTIEGIDEGQEFYLANNRRVKAIGLASTYCWFGREDTTKSDSMECTFYVFGKLGPSVIMGMQFLSDTKTLTNHHGRLEKQKIPKLQALQLRSLGRPSNGLVCFLDGTLTLATPDSGSDLDIMSPRLATERGLPIVDLKEEIEFADGSTAFTCGVVRVELAISNGGQGLTHTPGRRISVVEFHLLENFAHEVLLGSETLGQLDAFSHNSHVLIPVADIEGPRRLDRIHVAGTFDRILAWTKERIKHQKRTRGTSRVLPIGPLREDQQENDRREREDRRIAALPPIEQANETRLEARKRADYDRIQASFPSNTANSSTAAVVP